MKTRSEALQIVNMPLTLINDPIILSDKINVTRVIRKDLKYISAGENHHSYVTHQLIIQIPPACHWDGPC